MKKAAKKRPAKRTTKRARKLGKLIAVHNIRVNRQGYDSSGRYWGVGQKLYAVEVDCNRSGVEHFRAPNAKSARAQANAFCAQRRRWGIG